jgi:signal transduction histidine kinase
VARDHLGLFDTPPDRTQIRLSLAIVGLLFVAVFLILPVRDIRLGEIDSYVAMSDAVMCLGDLITATLLFAQASVFRSRALAVLGAGYVYTAALLVPHALTFPGAFSPNGLLGAGLNTPAWLAVLRRVALPITVIVYVQLKRSEAAAQPGAERPAAKIGVALLAAVALSAAVTLLVMIGQGFLPPFLINRSGLFHSNLVVFEALQLALLAVAAFALFRTRSSVLDVWLLVALSGWLAQSLLNMALRGRFTAGWYGLSVIMVFSHLVVMLALIAESNRLYARLALAMAARSREREARLMSIDAVAVAIAHEVGQPLTAVTLHAKSGLNWLTRTPPDAEKAAKSLRGAIEAAHRTTDVVRSIRAMFSERPELATEVSLNDLVRATAALLDVELAGEKVSVQLALDDTLPPVLADRVQMQRVLLNLFTNAIQSLHGTHGRPRRIAVRSARLDGHDVLLEVTDNGVGIAPEELEHIFEAFHTTKPTGAGVGLSLCRTIVGAHGGRLWATPGKAHGATFHLQLPRSDLPALTPADQAG